MPPAQQYLEMLLNVLPVVGDATGRDAWLPHQLKTDLPTQVVGDVSLLERSKAGSGEAEGDQHQREG